MPSDPRPLRVLMILESGFPVRGGGGAESQVRTLALELIRRGHRVTVLTPCVDNAPQARAERCWGIPVCRLVYPRVRGLGRFALWLRLLAFLYGRGRRYDAWHVHIAHHLGAIACRVAPRLGRPTVVKISGWWELERGLLAPQAGLFARIGRAWLRRASALQAISQRIAAELVRNGFPRERIAALPNAVDTGRFALRAAHTDATAPLNVLFVGRLVREKDLSTLLSAWARALPERGRARLRLVGGGGLEAALRAQAAELGITADVEFLGHRDDVEALIGEADLGVLPSLSEGLSNTLLEFMAGGLAVVASRVSGSEDVVVDGRNGWLFAPGDVAALTAALGAAAALPRAQLDALGRQARADIETFAGLGSVVDRLVALYRGADPATLARTPLAAPQWQGGT
jgi:glycosyltransferase involved in cell wall biosynthesis